MENPPTTVGVAEPFARGTTEVEACYKLTVGVLCERRFAKTKEFAQLLDA